MNILAEQLEMVRRWASEGIDLNGIQKRLQSECGLHLTYMDVRFLLLDHNIEIATEPPAAPEAPEAQAEEPAPREAEEPAAEGAGKVHVTLDDLQLPGTLCSGKAEFPGGARGAWIVDQMGRFGWTELSGQPSPAEMGEFERELMALISRG